MWVQDRAAAAAAAGHGGLVGALLAETPRWRAYNAAGLFWLLSSLVFLNGWAFVAAAAASLPLVAAVAFTRAPEVGRSGEGPPPARRFWRGARCA